jgi:hypothetical protein
MGAFTVVMVGPRLQMSVSLPGDPGSPVVWDNLGSFFDQKSGGLLDRCVAHVNVQKMDVNMGTQRAGAKARTTGHVNGPSKDGP